jgi:hypothetical protein
LGYDETLASKIHALLMAIGPCDRSSMFGAVAFTVNGNVAAGVEDSSVFMRVGDAHAADLLKLPGMKPWPQDGKAQKGWVVQTPNAVAPTVVMRERLGWAYRAAAALPAKEVPRPVAPPPPPPPPPAPPPKAAAPRRSPPKAPAVQPPPPPVTSVIAPGMSRPLAPPSRFPYNPEAARSAPPPLVSKAVKPKTRPPESSERGRLEAGLPASLAAKKAPQTRDARRGGKMPSRKTAAVKPARGKPPKKTAKTSKSSAARRAPAKPRAKVARPSRSKPSPARKGAKQRPAARSGKKSGKKRK